MSRRPLVRRLAALVVGVTAVAGCGVPSNAPDGYGEQVQASFVVGCTGDVPETDGSTTTLGNPDACGCAYEVFVAQVPYDDGARQDEKYAGYPADAPTFKTLNSGLDKDAESVNDLPQDVRDALGDCRAPGAGVLAPSDGAPSTGDTAGASDGAPSTGDTAAPSDGAPSTGDTAVTSGP